MPIALGTAPVTQVGSTTAATSYASSSWTPSANSLVLACIFHRGDNVAAPGVTHTGLTFSLIAGPFNLSSDTTMEIWAALAGASPSASVTTVGTWGVAKTGCHMFVQSFTGVTGDGTIGPGAGKAIVRSADSGTVTATSATATLAAASDPLNRAFAFNGHRANEVTNPATNWTELFDTAFNNPVSGAEAEWRSDVFDTAASASWTTSSLARLVAFELNGAEPEAPMFGETHLPFIPRGRSM